MAEQYSALPYRLIDGHPQVMLVTSRETKRWILPKGKPEKGLPAWQVAAKEAYEEAGLVGEIRSTPFATYKTQAGLPPGEPPIDMTVFLMEVTGELDDWPEKGQRERRWVTPGEAAILVQDGPLVQTLLLFDSQFD